MLQNSCLFNRFYKIPAVLIDGLKQQNAVGKTKFGVKSIYQGLVSIFLIYEIERNIHKFVNFHLKKSLESHDKSNNLQVSLHIISLDVPFFGKGLFNHLS